MEYRLFRIEWSAFFGSMRFPQYGTVKIPAETRDDAIAAFVNRWPEVAIESVVEVTGEKGGE